jgi:glycosyltransferase involved in cell wall biosynthesis
MSDPLVSVVTPFHNTARWLPKCIESVLGQSFSNFEYILVDNASSDGGREIAESYAQRDRRIRLISTSRLLPQVANYNFALSQISRATRYCKIAQADDWLYPQFIDACVDAAGMRDDIDLVSCFVHWNASVIPAGLDFEDCLMSGRDACRLFFCRDAYVFGSPTAQFWRADVVRKRPQFYDPAMAPFEDADVCFEVLDGRSFAFVHQVLCYSRKEAGSILDGLVGSGWPQAHRIATLLRWGHRYLTDAEYESLRAKWWREYRMILAAAALRKPNAEFAAFHARMMTAAGMEPAAENLIFPILALCFDRIGNPKRTIGAMLERFRRSKGGASK